MKDKRKIRSRVLIGGVIGASLLVAIASGCNNNKESNTTPTTTKSLSDETTIESSIETEEIISSGDFVLETLDPDYSSPTRETTSSNDGNTYVGGNNAGSGVIENIKETTPNNQVTVISTPTETSQIKVSNETTTVETDINGTQPGWTEPEIIPTGTDPLPVEPTKITIDITSESTQSTSSTESTTKTTETTVENIVVTTPIETVDPDDPNNILDKNISKNNGKVLALKLR